MSKILNVFIYQEKDYKGRWRCVNAYIPKDQEDYERVCKLSATDNGRTINLIDLKNYESYEEINKDIEQWSYLQETDRLLDKPEIYDAR